MKTKRIALGGILVALALVLSYVEAQVPAFFSVPGMKLGLTNLVVLCAFYQLDEKSALGINMLRILLVGVLFGNGASLIYSLCGGMLSWLVMALLQKNHRFSLISVSIAGGVAHNSGQILAAMWMLKTAAVGYYLPMLWIGGIAAGAVIGVLSAAVLKRLRHVTKEYA